jgi:glycine cleavage system aminomethyltransferase T
VQPPAARYVADGLSVHAPVPSRPGSLEAIVQRAGGVRATRDGHVVVTSYGCPAGELAACVTGVGLADRSELTKVLVDGPPAAVRELTSRLTDAELAPGGAVRAGGAWWCAAGAERAIVLCEPEYGARLRAALVRERPRQPSITVTDHTGDWATLAVVGRRVRDLLAALGVYGPSGDPRAVSPVRGHRCGAVAAVWLLQSDDTAWAVLPRADAPALWRTLERAGRPLALCAVGQEAISRYALIRRAAAPL